MDETLSRFVDKTGCDPSFARDLLEGKNWNFDEALNAFQELSLVASNEPSTQQIRGKMTKPQRGISVVNSDIVQKARNKVLHRESNVTDSQNEGFEEMARFTFVLPDLSCYSKDFADFLREDLIETSALVALEQSGNLNWWSDIGICHRLVPLATVGDGNCLLHAASLGMWGFHDRLLTLRKALFSTLVSAVASGAIKRRWRLQQYQRNMEAGGLVYTDDEWEKEWGEVLRLASTSRRKLNNRPKLNKNQSLPSIDEGGEIKVQPVGENEPNKPPTQEHSPELTPQSSSEDKEETLKKCDLTESTKVDTEVSTEDKKEKANLNDENKEESEGAFESLEEIHVFVLANVLRRPIIIIADKFLRDFSGDPIAPIPFGGIFLPCECPPEKCLKTPLILAFESAHFSAVVASEGKGKQESLPVTAIPVVNHDYQLLPIHFSVDPGENFDWSTLDKETELPSNLLLSAEQKIELLAKYLDLVHIKIPSSAKAAQSQGKVDAQQSQKGSQTNEKKKEVVKEGDKSINSWFSSQFNKVGNLAGKIKGSFDSNTLCAAKLKTDQKPEYYTEMIKNYIESAKERFEERKKIQQATSSEPGSSQSGSYLCPTPGCQLYGKADTNYLCSGCYRTQKSASEARLYKKPASSETQAEGKSATFKSYLPPISTYLDYPNSINNYSRGSTSTRNIPSSTPKVAPPTYAQACQSNQTTESNRCLTEGCSFYGRPDQKGLCSSCYKKRTH